MIPLLEFYGIFASLYKPPFFLILLNDDQEDKILGKKYQILEQLNHILLSEHPEGTPFSQSFLLKGVSDT